MISRILLVLALLFAALPAPARDRDVATREPMTKDGKFSICEFQDFDHCAVLNDKTVRKYRLVAEEKRHLNDLQRIAASGQAVTLADLEKSFGNAYKVFSHDRPTDMTYVWYRNSTGLNDLTAKCPECGIYVTLSDGLPSEMFYIVDEKFTVVWYRANVPKPPESEPKPPESEPPQKSGE